MKKIILVLSALSLLLFATSCRKKITGDGPSITQSRTLTGFYQSIVEHPGDFVCNAGTRL